MTAGLLLCARGLAEPLGLVMRSVAEILTNAAATRSRAYEIAGAISDLLPSLTRGPGRPKLERDVPEASEALELCGEMLRFVMSHPGCVHTGAERARYGEQFRLFVLELRDRHQDMALSAFADAIHVPLGTIEDWRRAPAPDVTEHAPEAPPEQDGKHAQMETVLVAYRAWSGDFTSFCEHVRREHQLEIGKTMIASILFQSGERRPARRAGRSRDEHALRSAFETFFPGAQWVADGKQLEILIDGEVFRVNLELAVDAASGAAVGIAIRDEEDSQAVLDALKSGVETTDALPLALLLDNRPSNHTPEVDAALGDAMRMRATPERPQNKAHVEGAFGLFAQKVPPIDIDTRDPRALARALARLVSLTFFRALNRAPRRDREGKTRVDLYAQRVTPEERSAAANALRERLRKLELARQTRAARLDPAVCALLDDAFARLALLDCRRPRDPERHVRDVIACYPRDAIVDAIGIFGGKRERGTLPDGVDARYLLGIAKNVHHVTSRARSPRRSCASASRRAIDSSIRSSASVTRSSPVRQAWSPGSTRSSTGWCRPSERSIATFGSAPPLPSSRPARKTSAALARGVPLTASTPPSGSARAIESASSVCCFAASGRSSDRAWVCDVNRAPRPRGHATPAPIRGGHLGPTLPETRAVIPWHAGDTPCLSATSHRTGPSGILAW